MKTAHLKYLLALLLFGSNGIVASYIFLSSYEIVWFRTLIGSLFLILVFVFSGQSFRIGENKRELGYLIVSGAAMGASWMFLYEAYARIGVGPATLAYYCGPVIVMALTPLLFHEAVSGAKLLGFLSVAAGMILVNRQELLQGEFSWGLLCGILSAVTYAIMVIFNKKATGITGLANSVCQLSVSFLAVSLFLLIKQGMAVTIPSRSIFPVLLLGIVNTGVGCYLYFSSIPRLPAQTVAIWGYLEPVSALIFSAVWLNERFSFLQFVGTALILGGAAFGEFYPGRLSLPSRKCPRNEQNAAMKK